MTSASRKGKFSRRAMSVQENLRAAKEAAIKARVINAFQASRNNKKELEVATLLQERWRQRRASKSLDHWNKIHAMEDRIRLESGGGLGVIPSSLGGSR